MTVQLNLRAIITAPSRDLIQLGTYQTQMTHKSYISNATAHSYDRAVHAMPPTGSALPSRQTSPGIPSRPPSPQEIPHGMHDATIEVGTEPAVGEVGLPVLANFHPRSKVTRDMSYESQHSQPEAVLGASPTTDFSRDNLMLCFSDSFA
jgi:hypothetical protein